MFIRIKVGMNPSCMLSDEDREERKRRRFEVKATQAGVTVNRVVSMTSEVGGTRDVIMKIPAQRMFDFEQMLKLQRIVGEFKCTHQYIAINRCSKKSQDKIIWLLIFFSPLNFQEKCMTYIMSQYHHKCYKIPKPLRP